MLETECEDVLLVQLVQRLCACSLKNQSRAHSQWPHAAVWRDEAARPVRAVARDSPGGSALRGNGRNVPV